MNIIITENQLSKIKEALDNVKVIYTAVFVNENELMSKYEPYHENIYYHHSTIEFKPVDISNLPIGEVIPLKIVGRLTNNYVDVIIVENPLSKNKHPHITLSTAPGVSPSQSNVEIEKNLDRIVPLDDSIVGVVGAFTNAGIIKSNNRKIKEDIITEVVESDVDLSSFKQRKELNPKIWNPDGKLNKKVRVRLLKIADDFLDSIKIDPKYCTDILFVGSLSNYFWSKYSDIDLHLLVDFKKINDDVELIKDYVDSKKQIWNDEHENLKIYGFPVEVYVQDINEKNASGSVYSIEKNKWIKEADIDDEEPLDIDKIKAKSAELMTKIDKLESKFDSIKDPSEIEKLSTEVKKLFDKIKLIRKSGLNSAKGEFSSGNIIFKVLRRTDYIGRLVDLKRKTYDKLNTIK